eukprot:TRINITY_DN2312_c0_g1_i4.p1 TRINITY_DN2312_c0_g1~~TRINITY_DN2312_c0_g1_i4.p1  ORF type:complete len:192 (+),score=47.67 TRINITY_DN2312_c0_g1_i4:26-601(+)
MGGDGSKLTGEEKKKIIDQYGMTEEKFNALMKSFKKHASSGGTITRAGFKRLLQGVMAEELADKVFDSFDRDGNGTMDLREYLMMMGVTHGGTIEQKLKASFEMFDKDGNGELSKVEVREMFMLIVNQKRRAQFPRGPLPPLDAKSESAIDGVVNAVFDRVDADGNGVLTLDEFMTGFAEHPDVCGFFKQF